jgi:Tfp pilus assembly protein PilW
VSAHARGRRATRGFTLVELMVALMGGLFISLAVFALARDAGRFYQSEVRIANATVGGLLGFERLRTDIARAGLMSSPNINRDPAVCTKPDGTWPANLSQLASIQITQPVAPAVLTANGRTPQRLLLGGAYTSSDQYSAKVTASGAVTTFELVVDASSGALIRLGNGAVPTDAAMKAAFPDNHALRIFQAGHAYYGQIVTATGTPNPPTVTVNAQPPIQVADGSAIGCGLVVPSSGSQYPTINVVNFIQYDVRNLATNAQTPEARATYATMFANSNAPGEDTRTELVRVEQDITGTPIPGTEELVAEYAVDFDLQITAVSGGVTPVLNTYTKAMGAFANYTGTTYNTANTPQWIRSVRVRLGVRSREADRSVTIANGAGNGLFRFNIGTGGGSGSDGFARVRTFQADVALHNQADITWQ